MAIAGLPMYDLPGVRAATDAWWSGLARHLRAAGVEPVPDALTRPANVDAHWREPDLLFSQTCGYPLTHTLASTVRLVATPCYDVPGCDGADYCSLVIVAAGSPATDISGLRGARCAYSGPASQSGFNALRALVAPIAEGRPFFSAATASGGHGASIAMVAAGEADVAAVDCVTHALTRTHAPDALAATRVLCRTPAAPGLPYVTAASRGDDEVARLRDGLRAALDDPNLADSRATLRITGAEVLAAGAYGRIDHMERAAVEAGAGGLA